LSLKIYKKKLIEGVLKNIQNNSFKMWNNQYKWI